MSEVIHGVATGPAIDPEIFERLAHLRRGNRGYRCRRHSDTMRIPGSRASRIQGLLLPLTQQVEPSSIWRVDSGVLPPATSHVNPDWHYHAEALNLGSNVVPTEVLCVQTELGELSCRKADLIAHTNIALLLSPDRDPTDVQLEEAGAMIIPLGTGVLNHLYDEAFHRSAINNSPVAEDRTLIGIF